MIIRNPYGFVVKHFKLINLILIVPMIYLAFKLGDITNFFNSYIASGYSTPETSFADVYVNGTMYLIIIALLFANIFLYFIFTSKKKNGLIYSINIIYFLVLIVAVFLFHTSMSNIEKDSLDATFANFVRDCAIIAQMPIYFLMIANVAKGVGFNYRTLRFDNNSDLKIKEDDDEEIEIKIGNNDTSLKKIIVHTIRELKYYVLENKFVFCCIGAVFLIYIGYNLYMDFQVYNKTINIKQAFNLNDFTLALKESYISDVDYRGEVITEGKYYLAIKIGIQNNNSREDFTINNSVFRIYIGNDVIYPSYDKSLRFLDIGEAYQGELIRAGTAHDYVFVYELDKNQLKSSYQLRILNGLSEKNGTLLKNYKKITVRPQNVTKTESLGELKPNQEVSLKKTTLGNSKYLLKDIKLVTSYPYSYEVCDKNGCNKVNDTIVARGGKALLVIEDNISLDESTAYYAYKSKDFYVDFTYLNYEFKVDGGKDYGDKVRNVSLKNITPQNMETHRVYEVPSTILSADKINLVIRIRNKYITTIIK